jgi:hypothetical protein
MRTLHLLFAAIICLFVISCSSLKPIAFINSEPKLDPVKFFGGNTHSSGVMESRSGKPSTPITTETHGTVKDGSLNIEQDLFPKGGKTNHRSWKLKQVDEHHVDATANDISGTAHGLLYGNYFSWTFRLKVSDRNLIKHVRMSQNMYLMPGGQTLIIRSIIRKFGIIVQEITEEFRKD